MKRKDLLFLTFLLSQTMPVWAMETDENFDGSKHRNQYSVIQARHIKDELLKFIRITKIKAAQYKDLEQVVLVGYTGSGKSTLINLLAGKNLIAVRGKLDTEDPILGSEIGHDYSSKTSLPSPWEGPDGRVYWDCPGFEDSKGAEQDIVNMAIREIFSGKIKILLAVKEEDLTSRPNQFLKLMNNVTKIFSVDELKKNLAVVVTKQGRNEDVVAHEELQKMLQILPDSDNDMFTPEVQALLNHLEANKEKLLSSFPAPQRGICDLETPRKNIFTTIDSLNPVENPMVHSFMSPEASLLTMKLAKDLNEDIENSIETILKPKIVQLCEQYTNTYASDVSMEGLEKCLRSINLALKLLENYSKENLMNFAHVFDDFFDQDENNIIKEYVKTLLFLKTLKTDVDCLTTSWAPFLQKAGDQIHGLIDSLVNKLFLKITNFLERSNLSVLECCKILPETNNGEQEIKDFTQILQDLDNAITTLQEATPENMFDFIHLGNVVHQNSTKEVENYFKTLKFLNILKPINYPKGDWKKPLNSSMNHLKKEIAGQQEILNLNKRLEEERFRHEEEARVREEERLALEESAHLEREEAERVRAALEERARLKREEAARRAEELHQAHLAEVARQAEALRLQQEENARIAAEAAERQRLGEIEEAARLLAEAVAAAERQRLADLEEQRLEREEAARRAEEQHQAHLAEVARQAEALRLQQEENARISAEAAERQRLGEIEAARVLAEAVAAAERQRLADLEAQRLAREEDARRAEEHRQLQAAEMAQQAEALRLQREENARIAAEAAERQRQMEIAAEVQRQQDEARRAVEAAERQRQEEERQAREETARLEQKAAAHRAAEERQALLQVLETERLEREAAERRAEEDRQARLAEGARLDREFQAYQRQIRIAEEETAERQRQEAARLEAERQQQQLAQQVAAALQAAQQAEADSQRLEAIVAAQQLAETNRLAEAEHQRLEAIVAAQQVAEALQAIQQAEAENQRLAAIVAAQQLAETNRLAEAERQRLAAEEKRRLTTPISQAEYRALPENQRRMVKRKVLTKNASFKTVKRFYPL